MADERLERGNGGGGREVELTTLPVSGRAIASK